ncbi:MAG: hypothetical protein LUH40_02605 [Clostridiales bacterium]|nr:hypothetical protein [Clostridiales bacterium]
MKHSLKNLICFILCLTLVFGSSVAAFAANSSSAVTPVVVVNDIELNPLVNTDDGTVVFDFSDYEYDILFTTAFSSNFLDIFSEEVVDQITGGDLTTSDIITLLTDYLGFSGDISNITNTVLDLAMTLMSYIDLSSTDITDIIAGIDFEGIAQALLDEIEEEIENIRLIQMNDDGTPANDNIGINSYPESLGNYSSSTVSAIAGEIGTGISDEIGADYTYVFTYDWRLDPVDNAALLNNYIENVLSETGADKVSVISEGYGSTIATAYLAAYESNAASSVKNFVTVSSEFLGTSLVGDFFKGDIVNEYSNLTTYSSSYIRWTNDISDNAITSFSTWLTNYILNNEWELQAFCLQVEDFLSRIEYLMMSYGITAELAKMPGLWALVPASDYDDAVENIYGDTTDASYIDTLTTYKEYQEDYENILQNAKANGINVSVVASWDLQIFPIGENSSAQSDGIVDTSYASFGATCVDLNNVAEAMSATQATDKGHDHISSTFDMLTPTYAYAGICHYIDASTCALPENTWFIKNMKHGTFSCDSNSMDFLIWLVTADEERTVWQNSAYQQFMEYNRYINPGILSSNGIVASDDTEAKYLLGDTNLDGKVTAIDSRIALRSASGVDILEPGTIAFKNGDVYADDIVNEADARKILLMSCGLVDDMQSGIELDYVTEQGVLEASDCTIELVPSYNSITNVFELQVYLVDAEGAYSGNFIIKYDSDMLTYTDVDTEWIEDGYIVAGRPTGYDGTLTCGFSVDGTITSSDCDENGKLLLATFKFDVSRTDVSATEITAGASHLYEDNQETYVTPISLDISEDFFYMLGDADNNRYITAQDARIILRIAARLESVTDEAMFTRCDVDLDGKITAKDARLVLRVAAKLITSYDEDESSGTVIDEDMSVEYESETLDVS